MAATDEKYEGLIEAITSGGIAAAPVIPGDGFDDYEDEREDLSEGSKWGRITDQVVDSTEVLLRRMSSQTYSKLPANAWKEIRKDPRVVQAIRTANSAIYDINQVMSKVAAEAAREAGHKTIFDK